MPTNRRSFELFTLGPSVDGTPVPVSAATYQALGALEVQHVERWIRQCPDLVGEDLRVITNQFAQFEGAKDRLDILALDRSGRLVVIEVKRDSSGAYQDLQALRYAAYVSTFRAPQLVDAYRSYRERDDGTHLDEAQARAELEKFIDGGDLDVLDEDEQPRIILVAGGFEAGVTSTVLWLRRVHGLDITCVQLVPYEVGDEVVIGSSILIPLPEAVDYEVRVAEKTQAVAAKKDSRRLDLEKAAAFIASVPRGRWTSYGDVAAAGGAPRGAMGVGSWLPSAGGDIPHVYRVLNHKGEIIGGFIPEHPTLPHDAEQVRHRLEKEGLAFDQNGRALAAARWRPEDAVGVDPH
jgi:alkylated DNA nucleotide flippase Atl1